MTELAPSTGRTGAALASFSRVWAQASGGVLLLASSAVLTPSLFGEFVLASSIFSVLAIFAGHGVYEYVLKENTSKTAPMTAAVLNFCLASVVCLLTVTLSFFVDPLFHSTHVGPLMRLLSPALFLQGGNLVLETVLLRRQHVTRVAGVMIASDSLGLGVALVALWLGLGPAALALQRVTREGALLAGYALADKWGARAKFNPEEANHMARFAAGIVGARLLTQGTSTSLDVAIGIVLSPAAAGLFRLANRLLAIAFDVLNYPMRTLMWVRLPPLKHDDVAFARVIMQMAATYGVAICALITGIAATAEPTFPLLFKPEWQAAWPVVVIMAIARMMGWPGSLIEPLLALRGNIRLLIIWDIANLVLGLGMLLFFSRYGLVAAAASQVLSTFIAQLFTVPIVARQCCTPLWDWLSLIGRLFACAAIMAASVWAWLAAAPHLGVEGAGALAIAIALGATIYIVVAARLAPEGMSAYFNTARSVFAKARGAWQAIRAN